MGEIADMMLDGILDANGEYTGKNPGHPVYPKGWFSQEIVNSGNKVNLFLKNRGIPGHDQKGAMVKEYGEHIDSNLKTFGKICKVICEDVQSWKKFKNWVDAKIGYVKPSKINKHDKNY